MRVGEMLSPARGRSATVAAVLAVLSGLLAMHAMTSPPARDHDGRQLSRALGHMLQMTGVPSKAAGFTKAEATTSAPSDEPPVPHHGPFAIGHQPCMAALLSLAVVVDAPPANLAAGQAMESTSANARRPSPAVSEERAPPDLDALCVSRT